MLWDPRLRTMVDGLTSGGRSSPSFHARTTGAHPSACTPWSENGRGSTRPTSTSWPKARSTLVMRLAPAMGETTWRGSVQPICSAISKPTVFEPSP